MTSLPSVDEIFCACYLWLWPNNSTSVL